MSGDLAEGLLPTPIKCHLLLVNMINPNTNKYTQLVETLKNV